MRKGYVTPISTSGSKAISARKGCEPLSDEKRSDPYPGPCRRLRFLCVCRGCDVILLNLGAFVCQSHKISPPPLVVNNHYPGGPHWRRTQPPGTSDTVLFVDLLARDLNSLIRRRSCRLPSSMKLAPEQQLPPPKS